MKKCSIDGSIDSIESFGLVDGPGIRTVVFLNGCTLRCKYCHNPEMQKGKDNNISVDELYNKIIRNKAYFKNNGGVTFSGGDPLLQVDFLIQICKKLKRENIHICLDTAGVGIGKYEELLKYIDIVLLDIKHVSEDKYKYITGKSYGEVEKFINALNKSNTDVWIRQVIVPGFNDNKEYLLSLNNYLDKIKNIRRIDFLPFHRLGREKYLKLNMTYPCEEIDDMPKDKCENLFKEFMCLREEN